MTTDLRSDLKRPNDLPEHRRIAYGRTHAVPWGSDYASPIQVAHLSYTSRVSRWLRAAFATSRSLA